MSIPKIMVFRLKELLIALLLVLFAILLLVMSVVFLLPRFAGGGSGTAAGTDSDSAKTAAQTAGTAAEAADSAGSADETAAQATDSVGSTDEAKQAAAEEDSSALYYAGIYTSSYVMNNQTMEIEVILDENHINSIRFVNVDDTVETVSPLLLPAMETLAAQIVSTQSFENLTVTEGSEYTCQVLVSAIRATIAKGMVQS